MLKKKFKEEEEYLQSQFQNENDFPNTTDSKINKNYKFGNDETEIILTLDYKSTHKELNNNHIHDLRFLSIQTYYSPIVLYILHYNPNKELLKLFNEIGCIFIENETDSNLLDKNPDLSSFEKNQINLESALNSSLLTLNQIPDLNLKNKLVKPKIIIYLNFEICDLEIFIVTSFLYNLSKRDLFIELIIMTDESVIFPLQSGMNSIYFSHNLFTKKGIGMLPMEKSIISTKGLRWDVTDWETNFGHINLSTSNEYVEDECNIYVLQGNIIFVAEIDLEKINLL